MKSLLTASALFAAATLAVELPAANKAKRECAPCLTGEECPDWCTIDPVYSLPVYSYLPVATYLPEPIFASEKVKVKREATKFQKRIEECDVCELFDSCPLSCYYDGPISYPWNSEKTKREATPTKSTTEAVKRQIECEICEANSLSPGSCPEYCYDGPIDPVYTLYPSIYEDNTKREEVKRDLSCLLCDYDYCPDYCLGGLSPPYPTGIVWSETSKRDSAKTEAEKRQLECDLCDTSMSPDSCPDYCFGGLSPPYPTGVWYGVESKRDNVKPEAEKRQEQLECDLCDNSLSPGSCPEYCFVEYPVYPYYKNKREARAFRA